MPLAYTPPGVNVTEQASPQIAPLLAVPTSICIVGLSAGVLTRTDIVVLTSTTAVTLPTIPTDATMTSSSIVSVKAVDPTAVLAAYPSYDTTNGFASAEWTLVANAHTIARSSGSNIPSGTPVYVTYTYTTADYFLPIRLDNMSDIQDRFGSVWDSTGTAINSPLSHAAQLAFENGASDIVLQPLFYNNGGVRQQPNASQAAAATTWADNYTLLRDIEDINVIVPVVGQSMANVNDAAQLSVIQATQDHLKFMADQDQYILAICGEDSSASSSVAQKATLIAHAVTLQSRYAGALSQQTVLIAPSKFTREQPGSFGGKFYVGGQYVAAAVAGMLAARPVSASLTRKVISGITGVADPRTKSERNTDALNGLMVIEQRGLVVQVRHGITLDNTTTPKREISVVRAKHRVIESVRDTLDKQIIGEVIADGDAPAEVERAISAVLELLKDDKDIVDYGSVTARTTSLDPTVIEARFSYKPSFPVNYVDIVFSLDLTNQDLNIPNPNTADQTATTF